VSLAEHILAMSIPEPNSGCWLWLGNRLTRGTWGYGLVNIRRGGRKTTTSAHRAAYELWVGPVPEGAKVLHRCDVTICVNPEHLFLGTQKDNVQDCMKKNRRATECGEDWPTSKLTWDQVEQIRISSDTVSDLARQFGVWPNNIKSIRNGTAWRWKNKEHRDGCGR